MSDPVLHVLAGPNGAGKSTLYEKVLGPVTHLEFVNADLIAAQRWPGSELRHAYEASQAAAERRRELLARRVSFVTETVFSHPSKLQLLRDAEASGFRTTLHVVAIPADLAVARVKIRRHLGGHDVPEDKIRERYQRLWTLLSKAVSVVDEAFLYDNTSDPSHRLVAQWVRGVPIGAPRWPNWLPAEIRAAGG